MVDGPSPEIGETAPHRFRRRLVAVLVVLAVAAVGGGAVLAAQDDADDGGVADAAGDERSGSDPGDGDDAPPSEVVGDPADTSAASIWLTEGELQQLPTRGGAWRRLTDVATGDWGDIDLGDNDDSHDTNTLAGALHAARTGDPAMAERVRDALEEVQGTFPDDELLPLSRNLLGYVLAADLIGYRTPEFESWLRGLLDHEADGRAELDTLRQSAERDPSNHGAHARATALAVGLYLGDDPLVAMVTDRFHDWLGRSSAGFVWRELDWQADPDRPVGVNPVGATIEGLDVDGLLPEEQRRSGGFTTEPAREGYVWEALQGAVVTAELLHRQGEDAWEWEDRALHRAFRWLHEVNDFPAEGDDTWQPWIVNLRYGSSFPAPASTEPGKNMGFTDWTHAEELSRPPVSSPPAASG